MLIQCAMFHLGIGRTELKREYLIIQEENVCEKCIYVNFIMIYYLCCHLFPKWIQHGNVIIFLLPILEIFITFLISQMVKIFQFWFCQMLMYSARPDALAELQENPGKQS